MGEILYIIMYLISYIYKYYYLNYPYSHKKDIIIIFAGIKISIYNLYEYSFVKAVNARLSGPPETATRNFFVLNLFKFFSKL